MDISKDETRTESQTESQTDVGRPAQTPARSEDVSPVLSLRNEIDRLFDDFGVGFWRPFSRRGGFPAPAPAGWGMSPAMEIVDVDGEYRLSAELPGMSPEDIEIRLTDGTLTIRGEKTEEKRDEKGDTLLSERRYGAFHRAVALPAGVDPAGIEAQCKDGVLTVRMPKTAEAREKERKIEVTTG